MRWWVILGALGCATAPTGPIAPATLPTDVAPDETSLGVLVERVRPQVVMLLNTRPDGKIGYGAGFLVQAPDLVLTSHHVIANATKLGALIWRADRTSYTPMDGGLMRYLFEVQPEVRAVEVVDDDPGADLALVRVAGGLPGVAAMKTARTPVRVGDSILVFGHPQETPWSFTSGRVAALPSGAIQHDAAVSHGSSGGPVLNNRGEVVGVSTAKVISESRGFAFARPIAMAGAWVEDQGPSLVDLSSTERAATTCWRALELGSPALFECFDWALDWERYLAMHQEVRRRLEAQGAAREAALIVPPTYEHWLSERRRKMMRRLRAAYCADCTDSLAPPKNKLPPLGVSDGPVAAVGAALAEKIDTLATQFESRTLQANGVRDPIKELPVLLAVLRMGVRVEEIRAVENNRAWVLFAGRNRDGSVFRFSECYGFRDGRWLQHAIPSREDEALRPQAWPPPLEDLELVEHNIQYRLLVDLQARMKTSKHAG